MGRERVLIKEDTSFETVDVFKELLEGKLKGEHFTNATVRYDKNHMIDENDLPEDWTLQLYSDNYHISMYCLTAGYGGAGPTDLRTILDLCGFYNTDIVFKEENVDFYAR